jgi:ferritin-like metal-binding protein YciE
LRAFAEEWNATSDQQTVFLLPRDKLRRSTVNVAAWTHFSGNESWRRFQTTWHTLCELPREARTRFAEHQTLKEQRPMKMKTLNDLFVHELKDLYSAEKQLTKALPKMAKAATNDSLREAFESHLQETEGHVQRLEEICSQLGVSTRATKCKAMEGLIEEGQEVLEEDMEDDVRDAALISAAQRVEHYEMAGYGSARTFAEQIGNEEAARLLQQTLDEEGAADKKLTKIAMSRVNEAALSGKETE